MNIRRSTDNVTSDFYSDAYGNLMTINGQSFASWIGTAVAYVTTWYDQSGSGNNATQSTTTSQPVYNPASKLLDFGIQLNSYMTMPNGTLPIGDSSYTLSAKHGTININNIASTNGGQLFGVNSTGNETSLGLQKTSATTYSVVWYTTSGTGDVLSATVTIVPGNVITGTYTTGAGTNSENFFVNGALNKTQTPSSVRSTSSTAANYIGNGPTTAGYLNGQLYFVSIFYSNLSTSDRLIVEAQTCGQPYPPASIATNVSTGIGANGTATASSYIAGQPYGNGTYTVASSSVNYDGTYYYYGYKMFDKLNTTAAGTFQSSGTLYNASGVYTGSASLNNIPGEWVSLGLPSAITLTSYTITNSPSSSTTSPTTWYILGSQDGATWFTVDYQTGQTWTTTSQTKMYNVTLTNGESFAYYAIVVVAINSSAVSNVSIAEIVYYGIPAPTTSVGTVNVGLGITTLATAATGLYSMKFPFTFTNMGATGPYGPSTITYGAATPGYGTSYALGLIGGIQYWTVPQTGYYQFIAAGGGGGSVTGGYTTPTSLGGVIVSTTVLLTAGQVIKILVGQLGQTNSSPYAMGGGGTFIAFANNIPILVAGGAGGAYGVGTVYGTGYGPLGAGQLTTSGSAGYAGGTAGANGSAGGAGTGGNDGGIGYYTNTGITDTRANLNGATAFILGGFGGTVNAQAAFGSGGFGGGGYSGGGGLATGGQGQGGGGGSYDINNAAGAYAATLYTGVAGYSSGYNPGQGFVIVNYFAYDPYYPQVSLLLHADGGAFIDSSIYGNLPKTYGTTTALIPSSYQFKYGSGSLNYNGSSYTVIPPSPGLAFAGNNWTIEFWALSGTATQSSTAVLLANWTTSAWTTGNWTIGITTTANTIGFMHNQNQTWVAAGTISPSTWTHYAFCRYGNNLYAAVNGIMTVSANYFTTSGAGVTPFNTDNGGMSPLVIGGSGASASGSAAGIATKFNGYIDDLRVTNGTARYLTNFVPPTVPTANVASAAAIDPYFGNVVLLLHADGTFADSSSYAATIVSAASAPTISTANARFGSGSIYWATSANTSTYVYTPTSSAYYLGPSNFTIEFWVYIASSSANNCVLIANSTANVEIYVNGTTLTYIGAGTSTAATTAITVGVWHHLAFVRNSATFYMYVDGVQQANTITTGATASITTSATIAGTDFFTIGGYANGASAYCIAGYVDDLRITVGVARYTQPSFSVPLAPYPNSGPSPTTTVPANAAASTAIGYALAAGPVTTTATTVDPYFGNVVLSLQGNGNITDSSQYGVPLTIYGVSSSNIPTTSSTVTKYGPGSLKFVP
jgi:hypothetical protein